MAMIIGMELFRGMQNGTLKFKSDEEYLSMSDHEIHDELVSYGL